MSEDLILRKAGLEDLSVLRQLMITTFRHTYEAYNEPENFQQYLGENFSKEIISRDLEQPDSVYWLGWQGAKLSSYFKLNYDEGSSRFDYKRVTEIQRIYVLPDAKGQGFGGLMIDKAKEESQKFGAAFIWLGVWQRNPLAIRFYQHHGFEIFGTHIFRLGNDDQQDFLMKFEWR